ncbi:exopolyphosphatase [Massilia terrae]|uniref:Ppx/GppA family phosphatase n=1 Tax=Massilia terrae TaxID=1811224 RepID=A0ABT2CZC0_9BURK|nr:Ppx/GppA phosphatase family protein [Massilia terrae]MCS0659324.1 Ppx/GppA family phosphatase [Massilia terrae]
MYAAVDLGSNSFRLHIGQPEGSQIRIVRTARDPLRLAAGLDAQNVLGQEAINRGLRCLEQFRALLDEYRLDAVRVVATNTLRIAANAGAVLPLFEQAIGYPIEVISGEEEGRLIYMGVARALDLPRQRRLVIDIGGGSTEVVLGTGSEVFAVESFGIGTHGQAAGFFADGRITRERFDSAIMAARARFDDAAQWYRAQRWDAAYGSSGTIRAIGEVILRNGIGDGMLSLASLDALCDVMIGLGSVDAFDLPGIKKERVPVMLGGLTVLAGAMRELGLERIEAVEAGLRLGVLSDLQLRAERHDRRDDAVLACLRRFGADEERAARTATIARELFLRLGADGEQAARLLAWSAMLHEIGLAVSHTGAHKHAAYIVENADLPGFTKGEQRAMAGIVLGQKGNLRKIRDVLADPDLSRAVLALRLAVLFMHAGIGLAELGGLALRVRSRIEIDVPRAWIAGHPTLSAWLDKEADAWTQAGFPMAVKLA